MRGDVGASGGVENGVLGFPVGGGVRGWVGEELGFDGVGVGQAQQVRNGLEVGQGDASVGHGYPFCFAHLDKEVI